MKKLHFCAALLLFSLVASEKSFAQTSDLVSKTSLRVCADPSNAPMSHENQSGFENKLAELLADRLKLNLEYTWFPMTIGFVRNTLRANNCDVVMGYAQGHELVLNTNHYYTSAYTLVVPKDSDLSDVTSLADPKLKNKTLGIVAGSPPATHMARNQLIRASKPYIVRVGENLIPPGPTMFKDLDEGTIDGFVLWGPIAGPMAKKDFPQFKVIPLVHETLPPRMFFRITMGVRQGEKVWARKLNSLIRRNQDDINKLLFEAGVPILNDMGTGPLEGFEDK